MNTKMDKLMKIKRYMMALLVSGMVCGTANAQLAPLGAMYFQNQYLNNPAFAGKHQGLELDLGYRQQWSNMPGSPKIQSLTGSYAMTSRAGLGLNINNDQTGLYKRTRIMGTYAYHLPLSAGSDKLSFGVSVGLMDERIDYNILDGDVDDPSARNFNQRDKYLDGDFGVAYTSNKLNVQASMPNLRNTLGFNKDDDRVVNDARYFVAASYKLRLSENQGVGLEPKVAFRSVRGFDNIFDMGANFTFVEDKIGLMGMYHTNKSTSFGFIAKVSKTFDLMGVYTSNTAALAGQTNGSFEVNMKINLFNK